MPEHPRRSRHLKIVFEGDVGVTQLHQLDLRLLTDLSEGLDDLRVVLRVGFHAKQAPLFTLNDRDQIYYNLDSIQK